MLYGCVPLVLSVGDKVSPNSEQFFLQVCKCWVNGKLFSVVMRTQSPLVQREAWFLVCLVLCFWLLVSHVVNIFYYLLKCLKMYQDMYIASTRCLPRIAFAKCSVYVLCISLLVITFLFVFCCLSLVRFLTSGSRHELNQFNLIVFLGQSVFKVFWFANVQRLPGYQWRENWIRILQI